MMYVYISPTVETAAKDFGLTEKIEGVQQRLESDPSLLTPTLSSRFPCWIRRMKNFRLIGAGPRTFGTDQVFCLEDILTRGSREYKHFLADPELWERQHVNWKTIGQWLEKYKQQINDQDIEVNIQPHVPSNLMAWLSPPRLLKEQELVVYESQAWVETFQKKNAEDERDLNELKTFHQLVLDIADAENLPHYQGVEGVKNIQVYTDDETKYSVLFSRLRPYDDPQRTIVFLLSVFDKKPSRKEIIRMGERLDLFGWNTSLNLKGGIQSFVNRLDNKLITTNDIARYSRRAYPGEIASDFEVWRRMEADEQINMAMSGEEENLLATMKFPAFINGRAGSGKSTMLHYAFSYYCEKYVKAVNDKTVSFEETQQLCPLFLTYSDRLTDKARQTVSMILSRHADYGGQSVQEKADHKLLETCFQTFQSFLLSCLPEDRFIDFSLSSYLSFHTFKKEYSRSFPQQEYSAEVCWHVIRMYIKGYHFIDDDQDYLSIDEYRNEIPERQKKISNGDFKKIFDAVWDWYFKLCRRENFWDDQDLTRAVLTGIVNGEINPPSYAAIFCDEAQDFTRIEFQLILRLSVWLKYQLPYHIENLPFAFAGDPLQTLNPTGFNWESFCASFYENILLPLDPEQTRGLRSRSDWKPEELKQNYRSSTSIVKFTNAIHLWRCVLFDIHDLEPQMPWWIEMGRPPEKGIFGEFELPDIEHFRKLYETGAIFLLPCDKGGEREFIQNSPILNQVIPLNDDEVPDTVYTSTDLKGLELSHIVVCWFGEYYANEFQQMPLDHPKATRDSLKLEYFLNKLYVAVSRSTKFLAIIDTQSGEEMLWQQAVSSDKFNDWLRKMHLSEDDMKVWKEHLTPLSSLLRLDNVEPIDYSEEAEKMLLSGCSEQEIRHLKTAIRYYREAQMADEVRYCEAWILRLEGKLQKAGKLFMELRDLNDSDLKPWNDAWNCLWEGKYWKDLNEWISQNPESEQLQWQPVIQFMLKVGSKKASSISMKLIGEFSTFLCQIEDGFWQKNRHDSTWKTILERYQSIISAHVNDSKHVPKQLKPEYWKTWSDALQKLATAGFNSNRMYELAGHCLYQAKEFEAAVQVWDEQGLTDHNEYAIAKAEITAAPNNISWFNQAELFDRTLQVWQEHESPITDNWELVLSAVRDALNHERQYAKLLDLEIRTHQWAEAVRLCKDHRYKMKDRERIIHGMAVDQGFTAELGERSFLGEFMDSTLDMPTWKPTDQKVREAFSALERIGEFRVALPIFERFFEDDRISRSIQKLARERWLVMKGKQADFLDSRNLKDEAQRVRGDRHWQAQEWRIDLSKLPTDVPLPPEPPVDPPPTPQEPEPSAPLEETGTTQPPVEDKATRQETKQLRDDIAQHLEQFTTAELEQIKHYQNYLLYLRGLTQT